MRQKMKLKNPIQNVLEQLETKFPTEQHKIALYKQLQVNQCSKQNCYYNHQGWQSVLMKLCVIISNDLNQQGITTIHKNQWTPSKVMVAIAQMDLNKLYNISKSWFSFIAICLNRNLQTFQGLANKFMKLVSVPKSLNVCKNKSIRLANFKQQIKEQVNEFGSGFYFKTDLEKKLDKDVEFDVKYTNKANAQQRINKAYQEEVKVAKDPLKEDIKAGFKFIQEQYKYPGTMNDLYKWITTKAKSRKMTFEQARQEVVMELKAGW
jgi:hypothetical protein